MRVERELDLKDAERDPSEVLKVMRELSKGQAIRNDDRRSATMSGEPSHTQAGGSDGAH